MTNHSYAPLPILSIDIAAAEQQFVAAMREDGVELTGALQADGRIHRANVCTHEGRLKRGDAAYQLHIDGVPVGWWQRHAGGGPVVHWRYHTDRPISAIELAMLRERAAQKAAERSRERTELAARATATAERIMATAAPASPSHPYLRRKNVAPHGIFERYGNLFIPALNIAGEAMSGQWIEANGDRKQLYGGDMRGAMFPLGALDPAGVVLIGEGYATMATCHEATGYPAVMAFWCHNLLAVASALRFAMPDATLVMCADDDWMTRDPKTGAPMNPGLRYARTAARFVDARIAIPVWRSERPDRSTDFNDLSAGEGGDIVRRIIEASI